MPNKNYLAGVRFERERMKHYESLGYTCFRMAGSHSPFDIIIVRGEVVQFIQCKVTASRAVAKYTLNKWESTPRTLPQQLERIDVKVKGTSEVLSTWQ